MMKNLSTRSKSVLRAIIFEYINTAEPVSSKTIATKYARKMCSATIRNIMADLKDKGYLMQPHTSSGRVPTEKGFRFYLDCLIRLKKLTTTEKRLFIDCFDDSLELSELMKKISIVLSLISRCAGIVIAPGLNHMVLSSIRFVKLGTGDILVVLIPIFGALQSKVVHMSEKIRQADLDKMSNYLSSIAKGRSLVELRQRMVAEMNNEKTMYNKLLLSTMKLGMEIFNDTPEEDVYVGGRLNVFEQPEFCEDIKTLKGMFKAFEEKSLLVKLLDRSIDNDGVFVNIGSEDGEEGIVGCSLVGTSYGSNNNILGTLGVIGPVRMNYSVVIPLVEYAATMLGEAFLKRGLQNNIA